MNGYEISTDPERLDVAVIHRYLSEESYWARGRSRQAVQRSIRGSLCFGLYAPDGRQAGFARVVSDFSTIAWLGDVFVLAEHRGRGLGKWLVQTIVEHPDLQRVRMILKTADAQSLYEGFGFAYPMPGDDPFMERRHRP